MPFGIASAPAIFQRMISKVLHGIEGKYAMAYLDDILIYSDNFDNHLKHIEDIFKRLERADLCLNKKKYHFVKKEIEYLGHIVSPKGLRPNPEKVRAIQTLDAPTTVKGVRSYLGLAGYYRNFIPKFSSISRPLTKLTRKNTRFYWDDDCQEAFDYFKKTHLRNTNLRQMWLIILINRELPLYKVSPKSLRKRVQSRWDKLRFKSVAH